MRSLIDEPCVLVRGIAATGAGARSPDQTGDRRRKGRAPVRQGAGVLKESTRVVLVKFPGTLAAGLTHEAFVALSEKRAAQPAALARTIRRKLAGRVNSPPRPA